MARMSLSQRGAPAAAPVDAADLVDKEYVDGGLAGHSHTAGSLSGIGATRIGVVPTDVSVVSTTSYSNTGINFLNLEVGTWAVEGRISYRASTASDLKMQLSTSNVTGGGWNAMGPSASGTTATSSVDFTNLSVFGAPAIGGTGSAAYAWATGFVTVGAFPGGINVQFSQLTSGTTSTTVFAGTWFRLTRLS